VLETDTDDQQHNNPVLKISERRLLRRATREVRINRYTLINFNEEYFALSKTCVQTRVEMQTLLASPTHHFASADALGDFLCGRSGSVSNLVLDQRALRLLKSASTTTTSHATSSGVLLQLSLSSSP
jgi:hypothetical protein